MGHTRVTFLTRILYELVLAGYIHKIHKRLESHAIVCLQLRRLLDCTRICIRQKTTHGMVRYYPGNACLAVINITSTGNLQHADSR